MAALEDSQLTQSWDLMKGFVEKVPSKLSPGRRMGRKAAHTTDRMLMAHSGNHSRSERWQQREERKLMTDKS